MNDQQAHYLALAITIIAISIHVWCDYGYKRHELFRKWRMRK